MQSELVYIICISIQKAGGVFNLSCVQVPDAEGLNEFQLK